MQAPPVRGADAPAAPLPAPFAEHFGELELTAEPSTLVAIDPSGVILWLNPAWQRFAEQNGGSDLAQRFGVGALYFDGIAPPLRAYYELAFRESFAARRIFEQEYECSSPAEYRLMRLRALPITDGGLLLEHSCVVHQTREWLTSAPVAASYRDEQGVILQCSNCRRVRRADHQGWDWVAAWVAQPPPHCSHGICKVCVGFYWGKRLRRLTATAADGGAR